MKFIPFKPALVAALLAAGLGSTVAHAEPFYAGANLGAPRYEDGIQGSTGHGDGVSGKVFGGYQVTPNIAFEAGYADLGRVGDDAGHVKARGEYLDAVGLAPITDQWTLLGRLGVAHIDVDTPHGDTSGNGLKLGAGAQYALTRDVALRGEWERYRPDVFGDKPNIDQYTVGVRYGF
jgi:OOP family OmpA-OmpF porin